MQRSNLHATAVVAGRHGLLVTGPSASGKTGLAIALIELCRARGMFASLVSDDQVWLRAAHGRLIADVPKPIAGLVEIYGFGPAPTDYMSSAVIDGVVALAEGGVPPRYRDDEIRNVLGIAVPQLRLSGKDPGRAAWAVHAWLKASRPG